MTETWAESWERSEREHRALQNRILAIPGSQRVVNKLTKQKADQNYILSLLANAVGDRRSLWKAMRRKKSELESLANQLETVASHAQRTSLDPSCYLSPWLAILGVGTWDSVKPAHKMAPVWIFHFMRLYVKNCRERATAFGQLVRDFQPIQRRSMIDCLLIKAWLLTGKYHDKEIAFLLTNAFEAVGSNRVFTEDQIKKHRQRYVVPRIKEFLRLRIPVSAPEQLEGDILPPYDSSPPVP
jgi:hypothetical protein